MLNISETHAATWQQNLTADLSWLSLFTVSIYELSLPVKCYSLSCYSSVSMILFICNLKLFRLLTLSFQNAILPNVTSPVVMVFQMFVVIPYTLFQNSCTFLSNKIWVIWFSKIENWIPPKCVSLFFRPDFWQKKIRSRQISKTSRGEKSEKMAENISLVSSNFFHDSFFSLNDNTSLVFIKPLTNILQTS